MTLPGKWITVDRSDVERFMRFSAEPSPIHDRIAAEVEAARYAEMRAEVERLGVDWTTR